MTQIKRISGGDFLSAGGTHGFLWENYLHKTYDKKLNYLTHPFDFREDSYYLPHYQSGMRWLFGESRRDLISLHKPIIL